MSIPTVFTLFPRATIATSLFQDRSSKVFYLVVEEDEEGIIGRHQAQWRCLCFSVSVWWLPCGANQGGGGGGGG